MKKLLCVTMLIMLLTTLLVGCSGNQDSSDSTEPPIQVETSVSIEKVLELSQLSAIDYIYNSIAKVFDTDGSIKYYVAYEGRITAGVDLQKAQNLHVDEINKIISFTLPAIDIQNESIEFGTMEYIFAKAKYETETVSQEAYNCCLTDLSDSIKSDNALFTYAKENIQNQIKAFLFPWANEYTIDIKWEAN